MSPRTFVTRAAAVLALATIGLAACESKTIVGNNNPLTISVSPTAVTLTTVGATAQIVALVTGGPDGTAHTVTWSSSNTAVATVDANGVVTAKAQGTTSIIATATADATVKAAAAVTVTIGGGVVAPPTVSISSITKLDNSTADAGNIFETINVTLNVDVPTGNQISSVNWILDAATFCTQTFTQSSSADASVEATQAPVQMTCQINTAKLDSLGKPVYVNGSHTLSATLVGPGGTVKASTSQVLVFNNTSSIAVSFTPAKTAADAGGLLWNGGNLTIKLTPSVFDAQVLQTITVRMVGDFEEVYVTKAVTANGNLPVTVVFSADSTEPNGIKDVEDGAATIEVIGAVTTAGQEFVGVEGHKDLRFDARPPEIEEDPVYLINTVGTTNWLNVANTFATACTAAAADESSARARVKATVQAGGFFDCQLQTEVFDGGVDVVKATFQTTPAPVAATPVWTSVTALSSLSETAANKLVARLNVCDNLGNCVGSARSVAFGVDKTPPIVQAVTDISGVKTAPQTLAMAAVDSLSGFNLTTGFVQVTITKDSAKSDGSDVKSCFDVTGAESALPSSGACAPDTIPGAAGTVNIGAGTFPDGYFTVALKAFDVAGNFTAATTRLFLMDAVAPVVSGVGVTFTTGTLTAAVNGTINDNVDLQLFAPYETFAAAIVPGVTAIPFAAPTVVKAFGIPVTGKVTTAANTPVILSIGTFGAAGPGATGFGFGGLDQAGNFGINNVALVPGTPGAVSPTDINSFATGPTNANVCSGAVADCDATHNKASTQDSVIVVMAATTTANPILTMYFYRVVTYGAINVAQFVSQMATPAPAIPSSGPLQNLRVFTYKSAVINGADLPDGDNTLFAVGVDKNGNGVLFGPVAVNVQSEAP